MMILRFDTNNDEPYEDYREHTQGYLAIQNEQWLTDMESEYRKSLIDLTKKYDLYTDESSEIINNTHLDRIIQDLHVHYVNYIDDMDTDPQTKADAALAFYYMDDELSTNTFFKFLKKNGAEEVQVKLYSSQTIGDYNDTDSFFPMYDSLRDFAIIEEPSFMHNRGGVSYEAAKVELHKLIEQTKDPKRGLEGIL